MTQIEGYDDRCKGCFMNEHHSICPCKYNIKYIDCPCFECLVKGMCSVICDIYSKWIANVNALKLKNGD